MFDYCNAILHELPAVLISRLQMDQNDLARVVLNVDCFTHSKFCLTILHWLPVKERSNSNSIFITAKPILKNEPAYLRELISIEQPLFHHRSFPAT